MITSPERELMIEHLTTSKAALVAFTCRLACALDRALTYRGVTFHAVNEDSPCNDPGDTVVKLVLNAPSYYGQLSYKVSSGLGVDDRDWDIQPRPCFTTSSDSELRLMADDWAKEIAAHSQHLVFRNLYIPKSIEVAEGYNDLKVAFRVCRAFDVVRSGTVVRFDCTFRNLAA